MAQTTQNIETAEFTTMRTTEDGGKFLVLLVTYDDESQAEVVFPVDTVMPV